VICNCWCVQSALVHDWIETGFALLAVVSCVWEARTHKGRYDNGRRPGVLDEPPPRDVVSALTRPLGADRASVAEEWSVETTDALGNSMHACSRGEQCRHSASARR
jgi:hypothetical protein